MADQPIPWTADGQYELFRRANEATHRLEAGEDEFVPALLEAAADLAAFEASVPTRRAELTDRRNAAALAAQEAGGFDIRTLAGALGLERSTVRSYLVAARRAAGRPGPTPGPKPTKRAAPDQFVQFVTPTDAPAEDF